MDAHTVNFLRECLKREVRVELLANELSLGCARYRKLGTAHIAEFCYLSDCTIKKFLKSKGKYRPCQNTLLKIKYALKIPTRERVMRIKRRYPDPFLSFVRYVFGSNR